MSSWRIWAPFICLDLWKRCQGVRVDGGRRWGGGKEMCLVKCWAGPSMGSEEVGSCMISYALAEDWCYFMLSLLLRLIWTLLLLHNATIAIATNAEAASS
nr:hypothetical protein CFP56_29965 [Quercus suber]